jgi:sugar phosphate isomerase/epimerase
MKIDRRELLGSVLGGALLSVLGPRGLAAAAPKIRIAGCDWSLGKAGHPASFALAQEAGLDGVEISCGNPKDALPLAAPERLKSFQEASEKSGLPIASTCLEVLHRDPLKSHPNAPKWVAQAIEPTQKLGARVILLPAFFKNSYDTREEQQTVADRLKELAPQAEKAGVVLGLENVLPAEDNAWILDKVGSPAVKVYYDVENPVEIKKYDPLRELAFLGKDRLGQIHLKDKAPVFGEGRIDFPKVIETILKTGFEGWLVIETYQTPKDVKGVFSKNAAFIRKLLGQ